MRHSTNPWVILVLVCLAQFMVILDATVVNVALPSIQKDLGLSEANLQWIVNAYTLVFGGFLLLGGRAGDLLGRKRLFLAGVVVFTVASLLNGLATNSTWLISTRALQGLGAAFISPAALAIISTTFSEGKERGKALGVWAAIASGGSAVGLVLGGVLTAGVLVAVDLLHQRADRHRRVRAVAAADPGVDRRARRAQLRRRRRRHRHRRPDDARLRDRQGAERRLDVGAHARHLRRRRRSCSRHSCSSSSAQARRSSGSTSSAYGR